MPGEVKVNKRWLPTTGKRKRRSITVFNPSTGESSELDHEYSFLSKEHHSDSEGEKEKEKAASDVTLTVTPKKKREEKKEQGNKINQITNDSVVVTPNAPLVGVSPTSNVDTMDTPAATTSVAGVSPPPPAALFDQAFDFHQLPCKGCRALEDRLAECEDALAQQASQFALLTSTVHALKKSLSPSQPPAVPPSVSPAYLFPSGNPFSSPIASNRMRDFSSPPHASSTTPSVQAPSSPHLACISAMDRRIDALRSEMERKYNLVNNRRMFSP